MMPTQPQYVNFKILCKELQSTRRRTNSPTLTRRRIKSIRDVGELVVNIGEHHTEA